jgi:hypothetical protein
VLQFVSWLELNDGFLCLSWRKLDPASEECKKLVSQYFKWEGEDAQGRKFNQGKILK